MADATEPWWLYYLQKKTFWCEFWLRLVLFCIMWRCFTLEKEKNSQDMLYEMNALVCFSIKTGQSYSQCAAFVSKFWQFHRGNESELAAARGPWTETFRPWAAAPSTGSNSQSAISLSCPASLLQPFLLLQRSKRARWCSCCTRSCWTAKLWFQEVTGKRQWS